VFLEDRAVKAAQLPAGAKIEIDGKANEKAWSGVPVTELFTIAGGKHLAPDQTRIRFLWDDQMLYGYAQMWGINEIRDQLKITFSSDSKPFMTYRLTIEPGDVTSDVCNSLSSTLHGKPWKTKPDVVVNTPERHGYTAEFAIPFAEISDSPQENPIRICLLRQHGADSDRMISTLGWSGERSSQVYSLCLETSGSYPPAATQIELAKIQRRNQTTGGGYATVLWLWPRIEAFCCARDVNVKIEVFKGDRPAGQTELLVPALNALWAPAAPEVVTLDRAYDGDLTIRISATSEDGTLAAERALTIDEEGALQD
jgi:hypothetical protein